MKTLMILSLLTAAMSSQSVQAAPQETITDSAAYLTFTYCPPKAMDCGNTARIVVKGVAYFVDGNTPTIRKQLENVIGVHQLHKAKNSAKFKVTGYVSVRSGSGWGPRTITVFVITQSTLKKLPLPRSAPRF